MSKFGEEMEMAKGRYYLSPYDDIEVNEEDCPNCGKVLPIKLGFKYPSPHKAGGEGYRAFIVCPNCDEIIAEY